LLVLLLAAQATVLRQLTDLGWVRVWVPLLVAVVLLAASARLSRDRTDTDLPTTGADLWSCLKSGAANPWFLAVLLVAFLIGYPTLVGRYLGLPLLGGSTREGRKAGALAFGVCFFYFVFIASSVWFGVDRVAGWMVWEMKRAFTATLKGIAGGLPLLLIFSAFFALTAETWQVAVLMKPHQFYLLIGLLVVLTVAVLFVLANQQLEDAQADLERRKGETSAQRWKRLQDHAQREVSSRDTQKAVSRLVERQPPNDADLSPQLSLPMRLNARLVVGVFQVFVFVPVGFGAMAVLWVVGRLAVPLDVATEWTYGDNAPAYRKGEIDALNFINEPWTRVPMLLAAFAVLYLTVQLLNDKEHRGYFFSGANSALQHRLAVRSAYRARLCGHSSTVGPNGTPATPADPPEPGSAGPVQAPDADHQGRSARPAQRPPDGRVTTTPGNQAPGHSVPSKSTRASHPQPQHRHRHRRGR
jgi:hypothetical protein